MDDRGRGSGTDRETSRGQQSPRSSSPAPIGALAAGGIELAVAILAGLFGGHWLDGRFNTSPWLLLVGVFLGAAAGFYNLVRALTTGGGARGSRASGRRGRHDR